MSFKFVYKATFILLFFSIFFFLFSCEQQQNGLLEGKWVCIELKQADIYALERNDSLLNKQIKIRENRIEIDEWMSQYLGISESSTFFIVSLKLASKKEFEASLLFPDDLLEPHQNELIVYKTSYDGPPFEIVNQTEKNEIWVFIDGLFMKFKRT